MRDKISTVSEIAGASAITAGIAILFGAGAGFIVGGIFLIVFSYLAGGE